VELLLRRMTLEEKIGQMTQQFVLNAPEPLELAIADGQIRIASLCDKTQPLNQSSAHAVEKSRLHIPLDLRL